MSIVHRFGLVAILVGAVMTANVAGAAQFTETEANPFGTFLGTDYVQYKGRFQGSTDLGEFDVPFEFVAPAEPGGGNGTVLVEPSHFTLGTGVRDLILTPRFLFNRGFAYAALGFGAWGLNVLDPEATPIVIAGEEIDDPGGPNRDRPLDRGIIVQFAEMLRTDAFVEARLGAVERVYATGVSQTSEVLVSIMLGPDAPGLFDSYQLVASLWEPNFAEQDIGQPSLFPNTRGTFEQPEGVGKILWVITEGDLLISNAAQYFNSVGEPDSRIYVIAGGAHLPLTGALGIRDQLPFRANGLDWNPVVRAAFVAGDRWVRRGAEPPPDRLLETIDEVDPVYETVTGIARDENLNALGGVRLPPVESGRFQYVASLPDFQLQPGTGFGLVGTEIDLECEPLPDGSERFNFPASYDWAIARQAVDLVEQGLLLKGDAIPMIFAARASDVGRDKRCEEDDSDDSGS